MKRQIRLAAVLAIAVIGSGCATSGTPMTSSDAPLAPLAQEALVEVHNHNWSDMVVYAIRHSTRIRLGMVTSMNTRKFEIPSSVQLSSSNLRLVADPIGGMGEYATGPISVEPGQRVELRIENTLSISNWAVW